MANYGRDYRQGMGGLNYGRRPYYPGDDYGAAFGGPQSGYHTGYRNSGPYDRDMYGRPGGGYDRGYKSRQEIEHGDPFSDRVQHTPVRTMRGEFGHDGRDPGRWRGNEYSYGGYPPRGRYDQGWRR